MSGPGGSRLLPRELGLLDACLMGLGSIVGTGLFVSLGIAAGIAGPAVLLALGLAAVVATFNGMSSAQLAATHAYSGGTYEYGHTYLGPRWGFTAGWVFLCAKSASAATAALGFSGYVFGALGLSGRAWLVAGAFGAIALITALVVGGVRRSSRANAAIVSAVLVSLAAFVVAGLPRAMLEGPANLNPFVPPDGGIPAVLHGTALMFVAYTGYARIATLGEEVRDPARTIPRAILLTLFVTFVLYVGVAAVAVASVGSGSLADAVGTSAAPLEFAATMFGFPVMAQVIVVGAAAAMLSVLLNLVLGLSRVLLAMGRRREMPSALARLDSSGTTPSTAVLLTGLIIGSLAALGDVRITWSFSAFTVLAYYAITNLAALRMPESSRRFPRWTAWAGLTTCLSLAIWVDWPIWIAGTALIGAGLVWHAGSRRLLGRET